MPRLTHSFEDFVSGTQPIILYQGYKFSDRPSRWRPTEGQKAIVVAKRAGKLGSYSPAKEYIYPAGDARRRRLAIRHAKSWAEKDAVRRRSTRG